MSELASNAGYADEVDQLFVRYESRSPEKVHAPWAQFIPEPPARILDIGSGTGRDAGWLASLGHTVVAAEPTDELRTGAAKLHPHPNITWVDDILPGIPVLSPGIPVILPGIPVILPGIPVISPGIAVLSPGIQVV